MVDYYIKDKAGVEQKVEYHKTRVILTVDKYGKGSSDPVWGTGWACVGTVVGISKDSEDPIRVDWDNNRTNIYNPECLQIYSDKEMKPNPNFTFKRAKKTATPNLDKKVSKIKDKYRKAMEEVNDKPVMTEKERKEALDLISSTKDVKEKMKDFSDIMNKVSDPIDEDDAIELYDDGGFFDDS